MWMRRTMRYTRGLRCEGLRRYSSEAPKGISGKAGVREI